MLLERTVQVLVMMLRWTFLQQTPAQQLLRDQVVLEPMTTAPRRRNPDWQMAQTTTVPRTGIPDWILEPRTPLPPARIPVGLQQRTTAFIWRIPEWQQTTSVLPTRIPG